MPRRVPRCQKHRSKHASSATSSNALRCSLMRDDAPQVSLSDPEVITHVAAPKLTGSPEPLADRCGARLAHALERFGHMRYCSMRPVSGKRRCKLHGGMSKTGSENGMWKGGISPIYRKALPSEQARRIFDKVLHDPALLSLTPEIALTRTRLTVELQEARTAASSAMVVAGLRLADAWYDFDKARSSGSVGLVRRATLTLERRMRTFLKHTDPAAREVAARKELREETTVLERLLTAQARMDLDARDVLNRPQAYALMGAVSVILMEVLQKYVQSRDQQLDARRELAERLAFLGARRDDSPDYAVGRAPAIVGPGDSTAADAD